jgi:hypothetical protein
MAKLEKVCILENMKQRGTGKEIDREDALVFDFMPVLLGNEFKTDKTLSKMLLREAPEDGPFMLMQEAYTLLGKRYIKNRELMPALECYKFALDNQTGFISFISSIQKNALLNPEEISHLKLYTPFEGSLMKEIAKKKNKINLNEYYSWLDNLRSLKKEYNKLQEKVTDLDPLDCWETKKGILFGKTIGKTKDKPVNKYNFSEEFYHNVRDFVDICIKIGDFENAVHYAHYFKTNSILKEVKSKKPKEILDFRWLEKYIDDNHPESSIAG